jgi:hypothetical protein
MPDDTIDTRHERSDAATVDRRQFVQTVGTAGVLGAIAGIGPFAAAADAAQPPRAQPRAAGPEDFPQPAGLRPGAQLDSRFPVSFATPVSEGLRLVMEYFTALSQRDAQGIARTLHFPFAIYEDIEPIVVQSAADFVAKPPPTLNGSTNGASRILRGSYDLLESINVHLYCPVGAAFSLSFTRYTPDGHKLLGCDGIYSVTNNDGRWAIQLASTIFHEVDFIGLTYPDAEAATTRAEQNYLAAFGYGNEAILNDPKTSRGSYEPPLPVGTRTASVNFGYGPRERTRDARDGHPMQGWRFKGVKSRLSVSTRSEEALNRNLDTNLPEFIDLAGETVGKYAYTRDRPVRPVTVHATHDKAHVLNGYFRYTADGTLISETRSVSIRIYKGGHWGSAGSLGQVTHHDRSNSKA